jgi:hypothetical protein
MLTRQPVSGDPPGPLRAAAYFAPLLARGLVSEREAIATLLAAAIAAAPRRDPGGMRMRLVHDLRDATMAAISARARAHARIDHAIRPLLAAWAAPSRLFAAAEQACGGVLDRTELAETIAAAIRTRLARRR